MIRLITWIKRFVGWWYDRNVEPDIRESDLHFYDEDAPFDYAALQRLRKIGDGY